MKKDLSEISLIHSSAETEEAPKEIFCRDFDIGCFEIPDPAGCKHGKSTVIGQTLFYTLPVKTICPLSDPI